MALSWDLRCHPPNAISPLPHIQACTGRLTKLSKPDAKATGRNAGILTVHAFTDFPGSLASRFQRLQTPPRRHGSHAATGDGSCRQGPPVGCAASSMCRNSAQLAKTDINGFPVRAHFRPCSSFHGVYKPPRMPEHTPFPQEHGTLCSQVHKIQCRIGFARALRSLALDRLHKQAMPPPQVVEGLAVHDASASIQKVLLGQGIRMSPVQHLLRKLSLCVPVRYAIKT